MKTKRLEIAAKITPIICISSIILGFALSESANASIRGPIANFQNCIKQKGGTRGLANYWNARSNVYRSDGTLDIEALTPWPAPKNALLFYFTNNALHYTASLQYKRNFDYVLVNDLNPKELVALFGAPRKKTICGPYQIWLYNQSDDLGVKLLRGNFGPFGRSLLKNNYIKLPAASFFNQENSYSGRSIKFQGSGNPKFLLYGMNALVPAGEIDFIVRYDIESQVGTSSIHYSISRDFGKSELKNIALDVSPGRHEATIRLKIENGLNRVNLEPRLLINGDIKGYIRELEIRKRK